MRNKITIIFIFFLFVFSFYIQDRYAISYNDDWNYAFIVNNNYFNFQSAADYNVSRQSVTSLYDAIVSQSRDYFKTNGRFLVHTTVQYLCGTKNMHQFIILNTLIFSFFLLLVIHLIRHQLNVWNIIFLFSFIWVLFPHKGLTFMGNITCSVNYLWSSVFTLLMIAIIEKIIKNKGFYNFTTFIFFFLFAFIAGSLQESFTIGVSGTLILYLLYYHSSVYKKIIIIFLAYIIGTCICMLTPANFRRFDDIDGIGFHFNSILGLLSSPPFILFAISIIIFTVKKTLKNIIKDNFFIVIPIFINLLFTLFIAYNGRHQLTAINVLCLIFIFRTWIPLLNIKLQKYITVLLSITAIVLYFIVLDARKSYYDSYMTILERAENSSDGIISGNEFENETTKIKSNLILNCNYIDTFTFQNWDFFERSLSIYLTKGKSNTYIKEIKK